MPSLVSLQIKICIYLCVRMWVYVCLCRCMCTPYMCVPHVESRGHTQVWFLGSHPSCFFLGMELTEQARLISQQVSGICLPLLPQSWDHRCLPLHLAFSLRFWELNSDPHSDQASTAPNWVSPHCPLVISLSSSWLVCDSSSSTFYFLCWVSAYLSVHHVYTVPSEGSRYPGTGAISPRSSGKVA